MTRPHWNGPPAQEPELTEDAVRQFAALFAGRDDVYGGTEGQCVHKPLTLEVYRQHLRGERSIGVYPLLTDGTCWFLALDFDRAGRDRPQAEVDAIALHDARETMAALGALGLNTGVYLERSKSKGAHLWIFFDRPVEARLARQIARTAYETVSNEKIEYFPKQDVLGTLPFGNYINLPYFGMEPEQQRRVMLEPTTGVGMPLGAFLQQVQRFPATALSLITDQLPAEPAPRGRPGEPQTGMLYPCSGSMINRSLAEGEGRETFAWLLAKRFHVAGQSQEDTLTTLKLWNRQQRPPLSERELVHACGQGFKYRGMGCEEPLVKPHCDPKCPIHPERVQAEQATYSRLRKVCAQPPWYWLEVGGQNVRTTMNHLLQHRRLVTDIAEQTNLLVPVLKERTWFPMVDKLLHEVIELSVPSDATPSGQAWEYVLEFLSRCSTDREDISLRKPIMIGEQIYFRGKDLRRHLTNMRAPDLKPHELWELIRSHDGFTSRQRFGAAVCAVWGLPVSVCPDADILRGTEEAVSDGVLHGESYE